MSASSTSACEAYRAWIEVQVALGRNAEIIYQDLVESHGFAHAYNSVKPFVARLKQRAPERIDVLEFPPGEEAQVAYGQGALTQVSPGKYRRPYLFVMTLMFSGKNFRKTAWKTSQQIWSRLHEEAFRALALEEPASPIHARRRQVAVCLSMTAMIAASFFSVRAGQPGTAKGPWP